MSEPQIKMCRNCKVEKPVSEFTRTSFYRPRNTWHYRAECKDCRNDLEKHKRALKRAMKDPNSYRECLSCEFTFNKCHKYCPDCGHGKSKPFDYFG